MLPYKYDLTASAGVGQSVGGPEAFAIDVGSSEGRMHAHACMHSPRLMRRATAPEAAARCYLFMMGFTAASEAMQHRQIAHATNACKKRMQRGARAEGAACDSNVETASL